MFSLKKSIIASAAIAVAHAGMGVFCTMEMKTCDDGTMVSRDPRNDCKFRPCKGRDKPNPMPLPPMPPMTAEPKPAGGAVNCETCDGSFFDGCNECRCMNGMAMCTRKFCMEPEEAYCHDADPKPEEPEEPAGEINCETCRGNGFFDGCNECRCIDGIAACTEMYCVTPGRPQCRSPLSERPIFRPPPPVLPDQNRPERPTVTRCNDHSGDCAACLSAGCAMSSGNSCMPMCPMDVSCYQAREDFQIEGVCARRSAANERAARCRASNTCSECQANECLWTTYDLPGEGGNYFCATGCGMMGCGNPVERGMCDEEAGPVTAVAIEVEASSTQAPVDPEVEQKKGKKNKKSGRGKKGGKKRGKKQGNKKSTKKRNSKNP